MDAELREHLFEMEARMVREIDARVKARIDRRFDELMMAFRQWALPLELDSRATKAELRDLRERVESIEKRIPPAA